MPTASDIIITGGHPLTGTVRASGAKNSALKLMAASILAPGKTTIHNVPAISDVALMAEVLTQLGIEVSFEKTSVTIDSSTIDSFETPYELVREMRASIAVLGPLLGHYGQAKVSIPGGCNIGTRPLDLHYSSLEALGVVFDTESGDIIATAPHGLRGTSVFLGFPSVGATENLMMAPVLAKGDTVIDNAAREPEIVDLANYLIAMGAEINGAGNPRIVVHGVTNLKPVADYHTIGDRIEAGTFLVAGALMGGPLTVEGIDPKHLATVLEKLAQMGLLLSVSEQAITIQRQGPIRAASIQTLPYPGFPTDLQAQFTVLDSLAEGDSTIAENIFENRFQSAEELVRMGASIRVHGHFAQVSGVRGLSGAPVEAPDLRGGAALVLAGLIADNETRVSNTVHIDRGYERFTEKLLSLGAQIYREA